MKVAISQSNYIPWIGYFVMIASCQKFVLYDDMQYTRRDWRNRNKIKTPNGLLWLSIPVDVKGKYHQKINETKVNDPAWAEKHLKSIELNYKKAPYFAEYFPLITAWYAEAGTMEFLSDINAHFIRKISELYKIKTELIDSREFEIKGAKTDALISVLDEIDGVGTYISGPAAKAYMDLEPFTQRNIDVEWMDYSNLQPYHQVYGEFEQGVTILDHILNTGAERSQFESL